MKKLTSIEMLLLVITICVLIATGILIHNKYRQEKVINTIRDVVNTEIEAEKYIKDYNEIVKTNCLTVLTLIQVELADSDYKTVKGDITLSDGEFFFYESGIRTPDDEIQPRNGNDQLGWVVISFDDTLEKFLINGNGFYGSNVFNEPLVAYKF